MRAWDGGRQGLGPRLSTACPSSPPPRVRQESTCTPTCRGASKGPWGSDPPRPLSLSLPSHRARPVLQDELEPVRSSANAATTRCNSVECLSTVIWQVVATVATTKCAACWCWCCWRTVMERPKMNLTERSPAHGRPSPPPGDWTAESKSRSSGSDRWTPTSTGLVHGSRHPAQNAPSYR